MILDRRLPPPVAPRSKIIKTGRRKQLRIIGAPSAPDPGKRNPTGRAAGWTTRRCATVLSAYPTGRAAQLPCLARLHAIRTGSTGGPPRGIAYLAFLATMPLAGVAGVAGLAGPLPYTARRQ